MNDSPPLLPVLVGAGSIAVGLLNGLLFASCLAAVLLAPSRPEAPVPSAVPGLLGLLAAFAALQVPAGVGVLLHRRWGEQLAQGMAFGTVLAAMLGAAPGILGLGGFPRIADGALRLGVATGVPWAVTLGVACRTRSMTAVFGGAASRGEPAADAR